MSEEPTNNVTKAKKPWYKKWWVWVIVIVVLAAFGSGGDKSTTSPASSPASSPAPAKADSSQPVVEKTAIPEVTVTATKLATAFDENEIKANQTYKGKLAKITGKVNDIGEMFGQTYITLKNEKSEFEVVSVQCFFKDKTEIDKITKISKGDKTTIIGEIDGKSMNVGVNNCKFE